MTLTLQCRVRAADDVLFRNLEGEAVLVGLTSNAYFGLDEVGTRIWELITQHEVLDRVVAGIVEEFEVEAGEAGADLLRLVGELQASGLVIVEDAPPV